MSSHITTAELYYQENDSMIPLNSKSKKKKEYVCIDSEGIVSGDDSDEVLNVLRLQMMNARKAKHLTQKELSDKCGLSVSCISNIENIHSKKTPKLKSMITYAKAVDKVLEIKEWDDYSDKYVKAGIAKKENSNV